MQRGQEARSFVPGKEKNMLRQRLPIALVLLYTPIAPAETLTVAGGKTIRSSTTAHDSYRAEVNFNWKPEIWSHGSWGLSLNHAFSGMTFRDENTVNAISWAPNLILAAREKSGIHPYLQLGFGVAYLSDDKFESEPEKHPMYQLDGTTDMGSHWQFESSLAVGLRIDSFSIRAKIYHYSNADLADENEGMDVAEFGVSYRF
jgi:lipid A 3-O-deacylase